MSEVTFFIVGIFIGGVAFGAGDQLATTLAKDAVKQCEAELPRNKQCEYVITARVKDE